MSRAALHWKAFKSLGAFIGCSLLIVGAICGMALGLGVIGEAIPQNLHDTVGGIALGIFLLLMVYLMIYSEHSQQAEYDAARKDHKGVTNGGPF